MEQNPFNNKKFRELRDKWYKKLERSGFDDIENNNLPEPTLKQKHNFQFKNVPQDVYEARLKYFANCRDLLLTYKFASILEKRIWELHTKGKSLREIEKEIKNKYKKDAINLIIHTIRTNGVLK